MKIQLRLAVAVALLATAMICTVSRGFWMGKYDVTRGEYEAVMGSNPSQFTGDPNRPVESVPWDAATNYCATLTQRERAAGRIAANSVYRVADGGGVGVCVSRVDFDAVQLWG
jgi:hypothetical protein